MTHNNIRSLSGNDIFLDSWNMGYVVQSSMWNNLETQLFWITTGSVRLDCEMLALVLTA
jgi:NADH:ubiquinone oxidoreductase subunit K